MIHSAQQWLRDHLQVRFFGMYQARLEHAEDGRWSSWIDDLPGCAAWGRTREEALTALNDATIAYIADMGEAGEIAPSEAAMIMRNPSANGLVGFGKPAIRLLPSPLFFPD